MKPLKLRIKDKHLQKLNQLASEVNFAWNYVNGLCFTHLKRTGKFFSAYDVAQYTAGASKELNLHSQTIQAVTEELITRRQQFKKAKLNWRVSNKQSARCSLGWIPFKKSAVKYGIGFVQYGKTQFKLWDSYGLAGLGIREWTCSECGALHDRDVNAAKNILALGHERLAGGIPVLGY